MYDWLCVATAFIKHRANIITSGCDDVTNYHVRTILDDTIMWLHESDPVQGTWCMNAREIDV